MAVTAGQEVKFRYGNPVMKPDHTAAAAIVAGEVVESGNLPMIAHVDIANGDVGAMAIGGGVYSCQCNGTVAAGEKVYWDSTGGSEEVTATSTTNDHFGVALTGGTNTRIDVWHRPDGTNG